MFKITSKKDNEICKFRGQMLSEILTKLKYLARLLFLLSFLNMGNDKREYFKSAGAAIFSIAIQSFIYP